MTLTIGPLVIFDVVIAVLRATIGGNGAVPLDVFRIVDMVVVEEVVGGRSIEIDIILGGHSKEISRN